MKYVLAVGLIVGVGMTGVGVGMQLANESAPPSLVNQLPSTPTVQPGEPVKIYGCRTEDSCRVSYANKIWTIEPDTL
jgi:hypothetical protein